MGQTDHGWTGRHRIRVARLGGEILIHFRRITSQGGRVRADIGDFFRKDYPRIRPGMNRFGVRIWIVGGNAKLDVDNVAKACLDALTGFVWHDDRQVDDLAVRRLPPAPDGGDTALYIAVRTLDRSPGAAELERLLADVAALG